MKTNNNYDIIIAGGGPGGAAAAIAAAREGAKVLVIEKTGCLGGMGTAGLVPAWTPFSDGENICYRGIAFEVFQKLKDKMPTVDKERTDWVPICAEELKIIYDDMLTQSGAKVIFHSFVCDAESENGEIKSITVANKRGLTKYTAKVYIDATGDGDVAAFSGAEFQKGGEKGELQAASLCFAISNIDKKAYKNVPELNAGNHESKVYDMISDERFPLITDDHFCYHIIDSGTVGFNAGHIWDADCENVEQISELMMKGRKMAHEYKNALAEYFPDAFDESAVTATADVMGTRESRRIMGEYVFTGKDYIERRSFDDEIGRNCYYIDIHGEDRKTTFFKDIKDRGEFHYSKGESHGIPYRCLIPKGFSNLLTCGRIISCDRMTYGSLRVMPTCLVTGQAAGTAAALSIVSDCRCPDVDIKLLREKLKENGANIK